MDQWGWLLYVQVLIFGVILLRQVLRPITSKRRTARAERMAAQILRESRNSQQVPTPAGSDKSLQ